MPKNPLFIAKWLILSLVIANFQTFSQTEDPPLRVEIPVGSTNETYQLLPMGREGVILYYRSVEMAGPGLINWYFSLYDTNLLQLWTLPVGIPPEHQISGIKVDGPKAFLLFSATGKERNNDPGFEVAAIDITSGKMLLSSGKAGSGGTVSGFEVSEPYAWLGINTREGHGRIYQFDLVSGSIKPFLHNISGNPFLVGFTGHKNDGTLTALFSKRLSKKQVSYSLAGISREGRLIQEWPVQFPSPGIGITECRFIMTGEDNILLLGTYAESPSASSREGRNEPVTTGFFSCVVNNGIPGTGKIIHYAELKNAEKWIGEKDILQLKKKALKKNRAIHEFSLDFQVVTHDIMPVDGEYLLTLEIFEPQYHSETFTDFDFYGRPYTNSYNVFDGYRFSRAIVAGFDAGGELRWDNYLPYRNLLTMDLAPKLAIHPIGYGEMVLLYLSDGAIGSRIITGEKETAPLEYAPQELMWPEDKLLTETKGRIRNWYDQYFLAGGYQEVKNIGMIRPGKRLVFYFSKVEYHP